MAHEPGRCVRRCGPRWTMSFGDGEGRRLRTDDRPLGEEMPMATYVLIPGAGSDSWYWHLVAPELVRRGHDVIAVDLPTGDDSAGFEEYADAVVDAIAARTDRRGPLLLVA